MGSNHRMGNAILRLQYDNVPISLNPVFMARKWEKDQVRLAHRLSKLAKATEDPMWLLIFPEGTNLSPNTRPKSVDWAKKQDLTHPKHELLPRSTGLRFCLQNLKTSVHWLYDCTLAYEGVPEDGFPQDYYTLRSLYLEGRPPSGVHMHWRKFHVKDIPLAGNQKDEFEKWLQDRWYEKDALLDYFYKHGGFPKDEMKVCVRTEVKLKNPIGDVFSIFAVLSLVAVVARIIVLLRSLF
jgi:1-acyl-sn-glycerol-3-phosphate acyltransferase